MDFIDFLSAFSFPSVPPPKTLSDASSDIQRRSVTVPLCQASTAPHGLFKFYRGLSVNLTDNSRISSTSSRKLSQMLQIANEFGTQMVKTQATFGSRIALTERKLHLHEAKAMWRLTELAFLFIPLSFSTSAFGMEMLVRSLPTSFLKLKRDARLIIMLLFKGVPRRGPSI